MQQPGMVQAPAGYVAGPYPQVVTMNYARPAPRATTAQGVPTRPAAPPSQGQGARMRSPDLSTYAAGARMRSPDLPSFARQSPDLSSSAKGAYTLPSHSGSLLLPVGGMSGGMNAGGKAQHPSQQPSQLRAQQEQLNLSREAIRPQPDVALGAQPGVQKLQESSEAQKALPSQELSRLSTAKSLSGPEVLRAERPGMQKQAETNEAQKAPSPLDVSLKSSLDASLRSTTKLYSNRVRSADAVKQDTSKESDAEFLKLIDTLEVRLQMQQGNRFQAQSGTTSSSSSGFQSQSLFRQLRQLHQNLPRYAEHGPFPVSSKVASGNVEDPCSPRISEQELWSHLNEQSDVIRKLTREVASLQDVVQELQKSSEIQVRELQTQLLEERRLKAVLAEECNALKAEMAKRGGSSTATSPGDEGKPANPAGIFTAPFCRSICGDNVMLSEDGYTAARTKGSRQCVLLGELPLERTAQGWYYEVEIRETVDGWVGGLGIGVTATPPEDIKRVPDKAWRMPNTFIIGYWGCVFLDGKERRTTWRADTLPVGAHVGVLVSNDESGDLRVFVDGTLAVLAEGALKALLSPNLRLFPVVDVFAATLAVALKPHARIPELPFSSGDATVSTLLVNPAASIVPAAG